jgi:hypothetical protein
MIFQAWKPLRGCNLQVRKTLLNLVKHAQGQDWLRGVEDVVERDKERLKKSLKKTKMCKK